MPVITTAREAVSPLYADGRPTQKVANLLIVVIAFLLSQSTSPQYTVVSSAAGTERQQTAHTTVTKKVKSG